MLYLGIDIGGTGTKAALVDERGQIVHHAETPTRASEGALAVLDRVERLARSLLDRAPRLVAACGVGSLGRIDHQRGQVVFAASNLPGWTGLALGSELSTRLGYPVHVDNDVNAAAIAEGWIGVARGTPDYLMITIGTGVGGAIIIGGRLWRGTRSGAGEVGHMVLYPGGRECTCGGIGCAEQYVSAKSLTRRAEEGLPEGDRFRGIRDVISAAERGPDGRRQAARDGVEGFTADLALALVNLQQSLDPQIIVVGGGIVRLGYWWDRLQWHLSREGGKRSLPIRTKRAFSGPQAGVIGAARLAMLAEPGPRRPSGLPAPLAPVLDERPPSP